MMGVGGEQKGSGVSGSGPRTTCKGQRWHLWQDDSGKELVLGSVGRSRRSGSLLQCASRPGLHLLGAPSAGLPAVGGSGFRVEKSSVEWTEVVRDLAVETTLNLPGRAVPSGPGDTIMTA